MRYKTILCLSLAALLSICLGAIGIATESSNDNDVNLTIEIIALGTYPENALPPGDVDYSIYPANSTSDLYGDGDHEYTGDNAILTTPLSPELNLMLTATINPGWVFEGFEYEYGASAITANVKVVYAYVGIDPVNFDPNKSGITTLPAADETSPFFRRRL